MSVWKNQGGGSASAFTDLTDVPSSYTGQATKVVKVKVDESGLEFGTGGAGVGDVVGPAAGVVDDEIVLYNSTTGKLIKGSGGKKLADYPTKANNLSDVSAIATARVNLGVEIKTPISDADYVILPTDKTVALTAITLARSWTLPAANAVPAGREIIVNDVSGLVSQTLTLTIARAGSDTINGATSEIIKSAYGMRRFVSDGTSKWSFDGGVVRINGQRVVTVTDAVSITPNCDTTDICYQANTQAGGTLTINAPTGTPTNRQKLRIDIKATNAQTYSWNAIFRSGTDFVLPTTTSTAKLDRLSFEYDSAASKWDIIGMARGY